MSGHAAAVPELASDSVIAFPTETFFAVGCDPRCRIAVDKLIELKSRPDEAGFPLIISSAEWLERYIVELPETKALRISLQQKFWPGPLTIVFETNQAAADEIHPAVFGPGRSLAVRLSPDPVAVEIARRFGGAVISTSANPRGLPPQKTASAVQEYFPDLAVVDAPCGGAAKASTIVDVRRVPPAVLREGPISKAELGLQ